MDNSLFLPKWKETVFDKSDLLPIYMHRKRTQKNPCYFDKELPSEDDNSDKKMEDNKVNKENKENIPDNEPSRALVNNKAV